MKKIFFTSVFAIMAIFGANAQVTVNARIGGGILSDRYHGETKISGKVDIQANIAFSKDKRWVVSPTIDFTTDLLETHQLCLPVLFGYKIPIGRNQLFIPKVGPFAGIELASGTALYGPSAEFAFEINHFVIALNGYYSFGKFKSHYTYTTSYYSSYSNSWSYYTNTGSEKNSCFNVSLTLGYKF